jgi:Na+-transporting NADH:ubiquinone oxidoreductase subunit C
VSKDSVGKILFVAIALCIVCSVVVSSAAVALRPMQDENAAKDKKKNVLVAAGLISADDKGVDVDALFKNIEVKLFDLSTGMPVDASKEELATYDAEKAVKDPARSKQVDPDLDKGAVKVRPNKQRVYLVKNDAGALQTVVLPIYGLGLWSTLRGFLALKSDLKTVQGLVYYDHKETPGLGGEVDNPNWRAQWEGKELFENGDYKFSVVKGPNAKNEHEADGISGATITCNGVDYMLKYWMSDEGFGKALDWVKKQEKGDG